MHQRTRLSGVDESDDLANQRIACKLAFDSGQAVAKNTGAKKQSMVGPPHAVDVVAFHPAPAHADDIESVQHGMLAGREAKRNDVTSNPADAGDHGALADSHELVDSGEAAEHDVIPDHDMTAQNGIVGKD